MIAVDDATIANMQEQLAQCEADGQRMAAEIANLQDRIKQAEPIVLAYAQANPIWHHPERGYQDPNGAHAWLRVCNEQSMMVGEYTADYSLPTEEELSRPTGAEELLARSKPKS